MSSKRRSIFGRASLASMGTAPSQSGKDDPSEPAALLRKRRAASLLTNLSTAAPSPHLADDNALDPQAFGQSPILQSPAYPASPSSSASRGSGKRASSVFTSFKGLRLDDNDETIPSPVSRARTLSINWTQPDDLQGDRQPWLHGEVQTSSSMFRKKKEYLVLTDTHLIRFKNYQKAAEAFPILPTHDRAPSYRHSYSPSIGSAHDFQSHASEHSGDRDLGTSLRQIVAVFQQDDGKPHFAFEIYYLDDDTNHASSMTLQFGDPEEMQTWLAKIREAANRLRLANPNPLSAYNLHLAARVVEAERDYVPPHYAIYKVVQRPHNKGASRASSDDLPRAVASVCFLAIGVHKVHLIPLFKPASQRASSPSLQSAQSQSSFGILTLTELRINEIDDAIELTFRTPLQRPKTLSLASLASHDIAVRLRYVEGNLRPEWESRPYLFNVPDPVKHDILRQTSPQPIDQNSLDRTLIGYCVAYNVQPENIRYQVTYPGDDSPRFELLRPVGLRRNHYTALELLAVMRSLRYNENFGGISFKDVSLEVLNGLHDDFGDDHLCTKTKRGTWLSLDVDELIQSCLLVQEIRALAATSRKLRRLDFSSCITRKPRDDMSSLGKARDAGCRIVEALFPLCKYQSTNVDWIALNNIQLAETDLDYLIAAAVERSCHIRGLELSGCGLTDRTLSLILDALRPQENTLEALDISSNNFRISPSMFDSQIGAFGYLTRLNLSNVARTSGDEPLISVETFQSWRLQELVLSGTSLNKATVDAIAGYLINYKQSAALRELRLDHCYLSGESIAFLLRSMSETSGEARQLHFDVSENHIEQGLRELTKAIAEGATPTSLTIRLIEFDEESDFRRMILAFAENTTIRHLDISRASLPSDASEETCQALERMFADNTTLEWLDMSGEDSRLETTKLGAGINRALQGLRRNRTLRILLIKYQKLGIQGANTLADVLKSNDTLEQLYCENNGIPLQGFTDLVNALHRNTTLLHLPSMHESRQLALKTTEDQVKQLRDEVASPSKAQSKNGSVRTRLANKVHSKTSMAKDRAMPWGLSDQDIKVALSLVDESWQRQEYRLQQYLQRNYNLANGIPTNLNVDDEEFERPDTAASFSQLVEKVQAESTPTVEKDYEELHFDVPKITFDTPGNALGIIPITYEAPQLTLDTPQLPHPEIHSFEKEIEMSFDQNRNAFRPRLPS